ncbi:MAG TPA: allantoicase [Polyangiales bacterium]|nr:allantoicase [Polyangiales bacterium]
MASFTGLIDLASEALGGRALACSDDFFAAMQNMLKPGAAVFDPHAYTDRGKEMDGWESRRKREPGYDHCIVELGCAGRVVGFDIDTSHFLGNHPPYASIDGVHAPTGTDVEQLRRMPWRELLVQSPLAPGVQNLFVASDAEPVTHLRLNIFPDGGVARFRAYGYARPDWLRGAIDIEAQSRLPASVPASDWVDLAAITSGGISLACSDAFYGPTNNLLLPYPAQNMGGGWETRRRRGAGSDWIIFRLGARGTPRMLELDTSFNKGNSPARCSLEVLDAPVATRITDLLASSAWRQVLPEVAVQPHLRNFFWDQLDTRGPATFLRLNVIPDGGMSRVRVWGTRDG